MSTWQTNKLTVRNENASKYAGKLQGAYAKDGEFQDLFNWAIPMCLSFPIKVSGISAKTQIKAINTCRQRAVK